MKSSLFLNGRQLLIIIALICGVLLPNGLEAKRVNKKRTSSHIVKINDKVKQESDSVPDFAYPQTVLSEAKKILAESSKKNNQLQAIDAVIRIIIANNTINKDYAGEMAHFVDSLANQAQEPYRGIYYSIEAQLYSQFFNENKWQYSSRHLPLSYFPENLTEWSGEMFAMKVAELIEKSLDNVESLKNTEITTISPILGGLKFPADKIVSNCYDLLAYRALSMLKSFSSGEKVIPFGDGKVKKSVNEIVTCLRNEILESLLNEYSPEENPYSFVEALSEKASQMDREGGFNYLMNYYPRIKDTESVGMLLNAASEYCPEPFTEGWMDWYNKADALCKMQRDFPFRNNLLNFLSGMTSPEININIDKYILSGYSPEVKVTTKNKAPYWLLLVRCKNHISDNDIKFDQVIKDGKIVDVIKVESIDSLPSKSEKTFFFSPQPTGFYAILPSSTTDFSGVSFNGKDKNRWITTFQVTDIVAMSTGFTYPESGETEQRVYVLSGKNGAPIFGAEVKFVPNNKKLKQTTLRTGKDGWVSAPKGSYTVTATYKGSETILRYWNEGWRSEKQESKNVQFITDLSIYHPGDSVQFVGVATLLKDKKMTLLNGEKLKVYLRDANNQAVDSLESITDISGRIEGSLKIPKQGLLGRYSLLAKVDNMRMHGTSFNVAEYKSPTFFVEVNKPENLEGIGSPIEFSGIALTYSGMPVSNAEINYIIKYQPVWWLRKSVQNASFSGTTVTDAEGRFKVSLSTKNLKDTPYSSASYILSVTATNEAGETCEAPGVTFSIGEGYSISVSDELSIEVPEDGICHLPVKAVDFIGNIAPYKIDFTILSSSGNEVMSEAFAPDSNEINLKNIASGEYTIKFRLAYQDSITASSKLLIYRNNDKEPPMKTPLWIPEKLIYASESGKGILRVGSSYSDSFIFCQVADANGKYEEKWVKVSNGIVDFPVRCSGENNKIRIVFSGWRDLENKRETVTVLPASDLKKMEIKTISFRDKINAGAKENWTFRIEYGGKPIENSYSIAVLNNKALTAIAPYNISFSGRNIINRDIYSNFDITYNYDMSISYSFPAMAKFNNEYIVLPDINLYGNSLVGNNYGFSNRMYKSSFAIRGSAPEAAKGFQSLRNTSDYAVEESVELVEDMASNTTAGIEMTEEAEDSGNGESRKAQLRPVELPLAFFKPMLTTDKDGVLEISFDVPDYNTTWLFNLLSYDALLNSGKVSMNAVASKPLMVQSNLPGFLRTGDNVTLNAIIYNNSEKILFPNGRIELFDISSGRIIVEKNVNVGELAVNGSSVISLNWSVPDNISIVGYRVTAEADGFSDGEQQALAILPSSSPVIDSYPFWLSSQNKTVEVKIPKLDNDATTTLRFCGNPIWYCITSLSGIFNEDSDNLFSLLPSLFATSVSHGLCKKYPSIKDAIKYWENNPADSMLVSRLEKNENLKTFSLNSTAWVNNTQSETARLQSLSSLIDDEEAQRVISASIGRILSHQNEDGGFSWCRGMKSGLFPSSEVLRYFGALKRSGYLPKSDGLERAITKLITYNQSEILRLYKDSKRVVPFNQMIDYLYSEQGFETTDISGFSNLRKEALNEIVANWKKMDVHKKAVCAIVLNNSGRSSSALKIIESLRQSATSSPEKGMWFANLQSGYNGNNKLIVTAAVLEAFVKIVPSDRVSIEALRQFLILQSQIENWGESSATCEVVNSILTSGIEWSNNAPDVQFFINDNPLEVEINDIIGEVVTNLSSSMISNGKLKVDFEGNGPAWGSVIAQYISPINKIKSLSTPDIKIKKEIVIVDDNEDGTDLKTAKVFSKGMKVRVILTLNCARDMNYVAIKDERSACMQPADQLSHYYPQDGIWMYKEVRDASTNFFIEFLPKGTHIISYDCTLMGEGDYAVGIASVQSQYEPSVSAHNAGEEMKVVAK